MDVVSQNPTAPNSWDTVSHALAISGSNFSIAPYLSSSDLVVNRSKDNFAADARDVSRSSPWGRSAVRSTVDAVIGVDLQLQCHPIAELLGVTDDEALEWGEMVEARWEIAAKSPFFLMDAQRKQTFTGLMRTAYASFYVSGEALGTIEWDPAMNGDRTCLQLIDPERLSDPYGIVDYTGGRRMGVERNRYGAPIAYNIREKHASDAVMWGVDGSYKWNRVPRYNSWGRPNVVHFFDQDRPDMTRGMSSFSTALLPMRLLQDYMLTELEAAAVRATYAAVIQSKLNYEEAMKVIGADERQAIKDNPLLDFTLSQMASKASFYKGQEFKFGKSKVAHLLPDEELKMIQGTPTAAGVRDFSAVNLYMMASGLGVDYATLTKDYSSTNYSGARAALFDVWRSYEVRRSAFIDQIPKPFYVAWLEEQIALRKNIPMLGNKSFYDVVGAICNCTFETWSKPRLDPLKENQADKVLYQMGAMSLRQVVAANGGDVRKILRERAREKRMMEQEGLKPEDIDWDLLIGMKKNQAMQGEGTGSEGGASSGSSANG